MTFVIQGYHHGYARLGPGSRWSRVLSILDPSKMTLVHGQCTDVGVGGYLVGGGVNVAGTTSKYGLGSENVDEYTLVTADARILTVTADGITTRDRYGNAVSTVPSSGDDDLFFALKGAGSNFGVVTEFLYRVHPGPETKPAVLFIFMSSAYDFLKLQKLSDSGRYQLAAYRIQHFKKLDGGLDNAINLALENFVSTFKKLRRSRLEPMVVMFTDLNSKSLVTPLGPLLAAVKAVGLRHALPSQLSLDRSVTKVFGLHNYDPNWKNYDALYLSEGERKSRPKQAYISSTLMSAPTPKVFADIAFKDPLFGMEQELL